MDFLKLYWKYICLYFKSRAEYKVSFFVGMFANFYCYFITFVTFWIITQRFDSIGGWNFYEISMLYGFNLLTYAISGTLLWYNVYFMEKLITTGELDKYMLRPIGVIQLLICQGFGYTFLGQIAVTLIFIVVALLKLSIGFSIIKIIYLILALAGAILIQCGGIIFIGSLSFWILRSVEIGQVVYYDVRSFINYPMNIYPRLIKVLLTFVFPWAFINYYPNLILLDKAQGVGDWILGLISPIFGLLFFMAAIWFFNISIRRYTSAGN